MKEITMKEITMYETEDGEFFKTENEARIHKARSDFKEHFKNNQLLSIEGDGAVEVVMKWVVNNEIAIRQLCNTLRRYR